MCKGHYIQNIFPSVNVTVKLQLDARLQTLSLSYPSSEDFLKNKEDRHKNIKLLHFSFLLVFLLLIFAVH
jgi:hypothetical protein